jgi:hypothetical protein
MPRFSYTAFMSRSLQANRLNMKAFAQDGVALTESTPLQKMERLAQETQGLQPDLIVKWQARGSCARAPALKTTCGCTWPPTQECL